MSYIKFQDDPVARRYNASFAALCANESTKNSLKVLDRCFIIANRAKTEAKFCDLEKFEYPVDGHLLIDFEVHPGETLSVYNNSLEDVLSSNPSGSDLHFPLGSGTEYFEISGPSSSPEYFILPNDRSYSRGCVLYIDYPTTDLNGEAVIPADLSCSISMTDRELNSQTYPVSQFFSHFANPATRNANKLINRIEITNPNLNFPIKVRGLIVYVKSNNDPFDCGC